MANKIYQDFATTAVAMNSNDSIIVFNFGQTFPNNRKRLCHQSDSNTGHKSKTKVSSYLLQPQKPFCCPVLEATKI